MNSKAVAQELFEAAQEASPRERRRRDPKGTQAAIFRLAKSLKVPLSATASIRRGLLFNGRNIATKNQSSSNILHDIAHYLLADPHRRTLPEYGLGASPDTTKTKLASSAAVYKISGFTDSDDEEAHASLLGILLEKQLGLDYGYTLNEHSWYSYSNRGTSLKEFLHGGYLPVGVLTYLKSLNRRKFVK